MSLSLRRALGWAVVLGAAVLGVPGTAAVAVVDDVGAHAPRGNLEVATGTQGGVRLVGWALDPDTSAPLYLWVTVDGAGRHVLASGARPDVAAAFPGSGSGHGFTATVPAAPGGHLVCVAASNVGPGQHVSLGCRSVTVPGGTPLGNFERATGGTDGVTLAGWGLDGDTTDPVYVWVTVDGVGRHVRADAARTDIAAAFPGYGAAHGFAATLTAGGGSHRVCVAVSNVGPGTHRSLGCRDVVVPGVGRLTTYEDDVLRLTNVARAANGVGPLTLSTCAQSQAASRAEALLPAASLSHAPLEPVLTACSAHRAGENLARGSWNAQGMVDAWLASPGHRANLLDARYTHLGVGCYRTPVGGTLCAQVFLG